MRLPSQWAGSYNYDSSSLQAPAKVTGRQTGIPFLELHRIAAMLGAPKLTQDEPIRSATVSHMPEGHV